MLNKSFRAGALSSRLLTVSLICSMGLFALGGCTNNQSEKIQSEKVAVASELEQIVKPTSPLEALIPDPALITGTLDNGVRYAILRNQTPPNTGALRVQFNTGSLNELPGTEGLAHYLEHMAFNGSKNVPEGEMIKILERLGLSFGADTNASTGFDRTIYKLNLPTLDKEVLDAAFMLMQETAQNLTLDQDAIERELGIILSEKRTRDVANYRAWEARMRFMTQGSDLMERLPIGTQESLNAIKAEDFRAYYDAHYHPDKTIVAFVGDAEPDLILQYIKDTFGDWQPDTPASPDLPVIPANTPTNQVAFYAEEGISTTVSLLAVRSYVKREDSVEYRKNRLLRSIATGMISYRMRELSEQADRPFINASMSPFSLFELTEGASFQAYTQHENWDKALVGIETELRKALDYGFTEAELSAQLARLESTFKAVAEGAETRPTTARRGGLIDQVMASYDNERVFTHPKQDLEQFMAFKDQITVDKVNKALKEMWGNTNELNVFVTSSENIENAESDIASVLANSRKILIAKPAQKELASEFAYTQFGKAGDVVKDEYIDDIDAHLIKFGNNVRLNYKYTDFEEDRVLVRVTFGAGMLSAPRKDEGLRRMMLAVVNDSGFEAHSLADTRRLMAGKLVNTRSFSAQPTNDSFSMTTLTVPDNLRDQLNIYTANLTAAAFDEKARLNYINKLQAWYPRHDATIEGVVSKYVPRIIRSGDKRFGFDDEQSFYSSSVAEIKAWLLPEMNNSLLEITVVGDIDKETVVKHVSETLGALPERLDTKGDYSERLKLTFPSGQSEAHQIFHKGDDSQAQLRMYWPASDGLDSRYSRELSVLRSIMRNRLVAEIREGEATTYSPRAGFYASQVFPDYGYVSAILTLKPEDIAPMAEKVFDITNDMAEQTITEDEFSRAITPIIDRAKSSETRSAYWMSVLGGAQDEARGITRHLNKDDDLQGMTVQDMNKLASEVFQQEKSLVIHVLPESN